MHDVKKGIIRINKNFYAFLNRGETNFQLRNIEEALKDFNRALNQEDAYQEDTQGIQLIYNKLTETLKNQGLEELEVKIGDSFDSEIHEAISQIPAQNDDQKGKVIDIIEGGYKLGDQVIKFPKVVVAQ